MNYVMERTPASPTVDEIVFLDSTGFKFTAYVDALDSCATNEAFRAFLDCLDRRDAPGEANASKTQGVPA